jgi:predicted translin family RNA/ssDNA-binding protein
MQKITGCQADDKNNPSPIKRTSIISVSDELSRTSASNIFRIQRKPEDRSLSKRSKKFHEEAEEALSLSKFYTKMKSSTVNEPQ